MLGFAEVGVRIRLFSVPLFFCVLTKVNRLALQISMSSLNPKRLFSFDFTLCIVKDQSLDGRLMRQLSHHTGK